MDAAGGEEKRVLGDTGPGVSIPPLSLSPLSLCSVVETEGRDGKQGRSRGRGWRGPNPRAHLQLPAAHLAVSVPLQGLSGRATDSPRAGHRWGRGAIRRGSPGTPPCPVAWDSERGLPHVT